MELGIKGKKALVTGGATGIGKAIALDLAREGAKVAITSRHAEDIKSVVEEMGGAGHYGTLCELADEGAPEKLAQELRAKFGEPDIVVNNVGSTLGIMDPYCPISDWRKVFRLVMEVAIELNDLFIPHMKQSHWGRIVNISAGSAMENNGPVTYCSMKAALTAYSRSMGRILAIETGDEVIMSAVQPGIIFTERGHWAEVMKTRPEHAEKYLRERTVLGRFGKPSEISSMVIFLCSNLATFCQGAIVPVDGGQARHYFNIQGI